MGKKRNKHKKTPMIKSYKQPRVAVIGNATVNTILVNSMLSLITYKFKIQYTLTVIGATLFTKGQTGLFCVRLLGHLVVIFPSNETCFIST